MDKWEDMQDALIDFGIATASEIALVTSIAGSNVETMNDILYVRTGYRSFDQLEIDEDDE